MTSIFKVRSMRQLSCEQWLMILAVCLFLLALRCPTGRFVVFSSPEEDLVSCSSLGGSCPVLSTSQRSILVKRVVDEDLLMKLERDLHKHYNQSGFPLIRASGCRSAFQTAIIVPYRNRSEHLDLFLQHMHSILPQQNINYSIYVVEQDEKHGFNRGKLFNIGYKEALRDADYCCFIFHDVDLLPENPRNLYACSTEPRHMCVALDTYRYVVPYADIFGGVVAMQKDHFLKVSHSERSLISDYMLTRPGSQAPEAEISCSTRMNLALIFNVSPNHLELNRNVKISLLLAGQWILEPVLRLGRRGR